MNIQKETDEEIQKEIDELEEQINDIEGRLNFLRSRQSAEFCLKQNLREEEEINAEFKPYLQEKGAKNE